MTEVNADEKTVSYWQSTAEPKACGRSCSTAREASWQKRNWNSSRMSRLRRAGPNRIRRSIGTAPAQPACGSKRTTLRCGTTSRAFPSRRSGDTCINLDREGQRASPRNTLAGSAHGAVAANRSNSSTGVVFSLAGMSRTIAVVRKKKQGPTGSVRISAKSGTRPIKYVMVSGYFIYKLTGKFADSIASQIGHIPFDYKKNALARNPKPAPNGTSSASSGINCPISSSPIKSSAASRSRPPS